MNDTIGNSLNLSPFEKNVEIISTNSVVSSDYEYARGNLISAIEKGQEALTDVVQIAGMTQSARSFEAVASVLNALTTANEKLLDLSKKKKDLDKDENNPTTVNNNLFVGSTAELLKIIKDNDKK
jgi:hypothetical protein